MVLTSLALQLFLLFAGNVRRRRRVGWLSFLVWLAYLASYAVVASAIGLFSQYEDKYKLRKSQPSEDLHTLTMPFLWAPFLLLHLGGPDTITAFSIEDNNLWTRQLLNLVIQLSLALYVFWKSFDLLDSKLLTIAVLLFVAGIIKYGERICALKSGSRDGLDYRRKEPDRTRLTDAQGWLQDIGIPDRLEARARNSAGLWRWLFVGRKLVELGNWDMSAVLWDFNESNGAEEKLKFVLTVLGMIYDMLYTKVIVLQSCASVFRCVALLSMVVAFVLFWANQHMYAQRTTNAAVTYTLFIAAIFMEVYSIFMAIASPWTRGRSYWRSRYYGVLPSTLDTILCWLSGKLASCFPSQGLPSLSMGQFNLTDNSNSKKSTPRLIYMVSVTLGLEKHWRNFWHVKHVEDEEIVNYIVELLNFEPGAPGERSRQLELGKELMFLLTLPFEHVLLNLHIFTELHLSTLDGNNSDEEVKALVAHCRKLSNYFMYLIAVYPSMLPVSSAAPDVLPFFTQWVVLFYSNSDASETGIQILKQYEHQEVIREVENGSPFKAQADVESLKDIKELWARLLIYAAGKCPMELHARQLGDGLELLTVVGSLLIPCMIGDTGSRDLDLLASPSGPTPQEGPTQKRQSYLSVEHVDMMNIVKKADTIYAFEFSQQSSSLQPPPPLYVEAWAPKTNCCSKDHQ